MVKTTYGIRSCSICAAQFVAASSTQSACSLECRRAHKKAWSAARYLLRREEMAATYAAYHAAHPEKARERSRRYEAAHKAERRASAKLRKDPAKARQQWQRWYAANGDAVRQRAKVYAAANRHRRSENQRIRRTRIRGNGMFTVTERDLNRLLSRYRNACAYCCAPFSEAAPLQWDHVLPIKRGGQHSIGNLLPSCRKCNQAKQGQLLAAWRARITDDGFDLQSLTVL